MSTKSEIIRAKDFRVFEDYANPNEVTIEWEVENKGCDKCGHGSGGTYDTSVEIPTHVWLRIKQAIKDGKTDV